MPEEFWTCGGFRPGRTWVATVSKTVGVHASRPHVGRTEDDIPHARPMQGGQRRRERMNTARSP